jgi:short subunit dehydrogenase-like uncharacterized protein
MVSVLVHGVTGFTGSLVSRELARRGIPHSLAGRRREAALAHAREVGAGARVFDLLVSAVRRPDDAGPEGAAIHAALARMARLGSPEHVTNSTTILGEKSS